MLTEKRALGHQKTATQSFVEERPSQLLHWATPGGSEASVGSTYHFPCTQYLDVLVAGTIHLIACMLHDCPQFAYTQLPAQQ
eukprot:363662-Chlamydomonas_euryale.AAC.18